MKNIFELLNEINYFETQTFKGLHKPQAIFFDWENTIVRKKKNENSEESIQKEYNAHFNFFYLEDDPFFKNNHMHFNNEYELIEKKNLIELLHFINKNQIFCGVISNKNKEQLNEEIEIFGLKSYFQKIIGEGDCPSRKPMIDPMVHALAKTEIEFGKTIWFIGDSKTDMEFASITLSTGILYNPNKPIDSNRKNYFSQGIKKKNKSHKDLSEDLEIRSMEEILEILKTMFL